MRKGVGDSGGMRVCVYQRERDSVCACEGERKRHRHWCQVFLVVCNFSYFPSFYFFQTHLSYSHLIFLSLLSCIWFTLIFIHNFFPSLFIHSRSISYVPSRSHWSCTFSTYTIFTPKFEIRSSRRSICSGASFCVLVIFSISSVSTVLGTYMLVMIFSFVFHFRIFLFLYIYFFVICHLSYVIFYLTFFIFYCSFSNS